MEEFSAVYRVLRQLAARQLQRGGGNTLDTTGLVHEAWLKLAVAATAMRQILVDHARKRHAKKRGGDVAMTSSALEHASVTPDLDNLLAIDAALTKLEALDERLARVVEWKFFAGLDENEIATALDVDVRTVRRAFRKARAFILDELRQAS
jgi:RNA polymerase sigma factor (TIGR02999 family)